MADRISSSLEGGKTSKQSELGGRKDTFRMLEEENKQRMDFEKHGPDLLRGARALTESRKFLNDLDERSQRSHVQRARGLFSGLPSKDAVVKKYTETCETSIESILVIYRINIEKAESSTGLSHDTMHDIVTGTEDLVKFYREKALHDKSSETRKTARQLLGAEFDVIHVLSWQLRYAEHAENEGKISRETLHEARGRLMPSQKLDLEAYRALCTVKLACAREADRIRSSKNFQDLEQGSKLRAAFDEWMNILRNPPHNSFGRYLMGDPEIQELEIRAQIQSYYSKSKNLFKFEAKLQEALPKQALESQLLELRERAGTIISNKAHLEGYMHWKEEDFLRAVTQIEPDLGAGGLRREMQLVTFKTEARKQLPELLKQCNSGNYSSLESWQQNIANTAIDVGLTMIEEIESEENKNIVRNIAKNGIYFPVTRTSQELEDAFYPRWETEIEPNLDLYLKHICSQEQRISAQED